jgi:glycerophosphoryl diester phosphodiesterase
MRTMVLKVIITIVKTIIVFSVALVLLLGIIGGGWGPKQVPDDHPLYSGRTRLIAHRGVSDKAPENTLAAVSRARELGFEIIEVDLKQSSDHKFYLFHDRESTRMFNKEIPLKKKTLSQLQQFPLVHNGKATKHHVPGLDQLQEGFSPDQMIYFDIKRHGNYRYRRLAARISNFLRTHKMQDRAFAGSDFLFTVYLEYANPQLHTVFTGPGDWSVIFYRWIPKKFRPDFIISYADEVTDWHLQWLREKDLINRRMIYGVDKANFIKVREWGIPYLMVEYDPIMDADLVDIRY